MPPIPGLPGIGSRTLSGATSPGQWGTGYRTPANRNFTFVVDVVDNLEGLDERFADTFVKALMFHLEDAAQRVIDTARHYLVRLEEPAVKQSIYGTDIHGYDTGLMYLSLKYELAVGLLVSGSGVFYDLLSEEAEYWRYVEFGHWVFSRNGPWFWPGYHFLETAISENAGYIRQRVREAWADTEIKLVMAAKPIGTRGRIGIGGPGIGGIRNVANERPF